MAEHKSRKRSEGKTLLLLITQKKNKSIIFVLKYFFYGFAIKWNKLSTHHCYENAEKEDLNSVEKHLMFYYRKSNQLAFQQSIIQIKQQMSMQVKRKIRRRRIDTQLNLPHRDRQKYQEYESYMPQNSKLTKSASPNNNKLKLMPIKSSNMKGQTESRSKRNVKRAKSYLGDQVSQLKGDISKIRQQIMVHRSKKNMRNDVNKQTEDANDLAVSSPIRPAKWQLFKPFWREPHIKKSLKKYKSINITNQAQQLQSNHNSISGTSQEEQNQQSGFFFPIIEKSKRQKNQKSRLKDRAQSSQLQNSQQRLRQYFQRFRNQRSGMKRTQQNMMNFRKVAHAVLFTIYLKKFNERMRQRRKKNFGKFVKAQLKNKLMQLKELIIEHSKPFFNAVSQHYNFDFCPNPKDDSKLKKQKLKYVKKLINLQIQCLKQAAASIMRNSQNFSQLLYFLCRHGSYSFFHSIYTSEEINLMCISEFQGYIRAQKWLQQSALVSLILIKLALFNVLMDQPLLGEIFGSENVESISKQVLLIGNILYQLFIDVQDDCLQKVPSSYKIGNWQELKHRINFNLAQNMTIQEGIFQKNQLISGLQDHKTIIELFGTKQMVSEKHQIHQIIKQLHSLICNHHDKLRQKSYIK